MPAVFGTTFCGTHVNNSYIKKKRPAEETDGRFKE
jgi:hypothetical protein